MTFSRKVLALVGAMIMLTPCCAQALNYNWAVTGVDGAALSGTSSSAIGAATALSVAALAHGGCASATETGFAVTSDTGVPGGSWSVSFMYSDTVTETNTIVGGPCNTGGSIGPFSVSGTITGTGLPKDATGWMHNYATAVNTISTTSAAVTRPDGKVFTFNLVSGTWTPDADITDKLVQLLAGSTVIGWQYANAGNDSLETYDAYGNLSSIAYREGTGVTMTYAAGSGAPTSPGQLLSVTDSFGKSLTFGYVNNILHTMTDPSGGVYTYALGSLVLSSVTFPDTFSEFYLFYEAAYTGGQSYPGALTGVIDENNSRYTSTWYGTGGVAIQTALSGGAGQYAMTNTLDASGRVQSVALVNPLGGAEGRTFVLSLGRNRISTVTQPAASGSPAATKTYAYDANGNIAQVLDYNGNVQCSVYDL